MYAFHCFCDLSQNIGFDIRQHSKLLCFPIVSGSKPVFILFVYLFSFTDAFDGSVNFPGVSTSMFGSTQNYRASSLFQVAHLHLVFSFFLYFHSHSLSEGSLIFFSGASASVPLGSQNFSIICHPEGTKH